MARAIGSTSHLGKRTNLPLQLTSFVGRAAEIDEVTGLLAEARLVTLTGAGGIGKTRVALEVAARVLGDHEDGVWLVELAGLTDPELVPQAVVSALGFMAQPGLTPTESLIGVLETRNLLCVLDNCEHLIQAAAQLADTLLKHCPELRILATSRDVLGVGGEVTWRVPSMPTPDAQRSYTLDQLRRHETVQLLLQRARAARPGFELNDDNAQSVARICQHVDGIPLAIELVAARARGMSVAAIEERIANRFNLVTGGSRVSMPRQRTLQATFDWSHHLLSEEEKRVFRRLSVFAGGFTLDAAESVCSMDQADVTNQSSLDSLTSLVDKSLVISQEGAHGAGRYRLLEPIRQYAYDRLSDAQEADATRRRHARFYLAFGDEVYGELRGPHQPEWMARVAEELANFRVGFGWAISHDPRTALQLGVALERYWIVNSPAEGREWLRRALELTEARDELRARALYDATFWAGFCGYFDEARQLGRECLALAQELAIGLYIGQALSALAVVDGTERAEGWLAESLSLFEQAEPHVRKASDPEALARLLNNYGCTLLGAGQLIAARAKVEEALALAHDRGDAWQIPFFLDSLAAIEFENGERAAAEAHWKQVLELPGELGGRQIAASALAGLARLAVADGRPERYLRLLGAASSLQKLAGTNDAEIAQIVDEGQRQARAALGDEVSGAVWREGAGMSFPEVVRFALGEYPLPQSATRTAKRTFMFTDIVRSTELVGVIGDEAWQNLLDWHNRTLRNAFVTHGGDEVDSAGDGFFVAFANPRSAVDCAIDIQRTLAEHRSRHGFAPTVRVGLHAATAIRSGGAYRGKGVHVAARVAAHADGDEILASNDTVGQLGDLSVGPPRPVTLKGMSGELIVVSLEWR